MKVDLHIHTTASDGTWTPEELVAAVHKAGIGLFAVTDHDSVGNVAAAGQLAAGAGLKFLTGVEIASTLNSQSFHILGYGIDIECPGLKKLLHHNTRLMEEVDDESVRELIKTGVPVDYDEYLAYRHNPARGGWKSLNFLIDKGLCRDINDFFAKFFTKERGIVFPEFPHPAKVVETIKIAGGTPVLAHPGSDFHGSSLEETLDYFESIAIEGIECFHPCHDAQTARRAVEWCLKHKRLITGGSDCHGNFVDSRCLGVPEIHLSELNLGGLLEKL